MDKLTNTSVSKRIGRPPITNRFQDVKEGIAVYAISHRDSGRQYVGSSITVRKRFLEHFRALEKGRHHSYLLQRAWTKYGSRAFKFEIIERPDESVLVDRENFWLQNLKPALNICTIAGSILGTRLTDETCLKMSRAKLGKKLTREHAQAISLGRLGQIQYKQMRSIPSEDLRRTPKVVNPTPRQARRAEEQRCRRNRKRQERLTEWVDG